MRFLDFNYDEKIVNTNEIINHFQKKFFYRIKKMIIVLKNNVVQRNLLSYFKKTVLM